MNRYLFISPLSRWTIHNDVDPQYLHSIQRIRYTHQCCKSDQRKRGYASTQLKPDKIANVVKNSLSFFNRRAKIKNE